MLTVTCIGKERDSQNRIVSYALQDDSGAQEVVQPHELKYAIATNQISVNNLKLTSDGRLIDREANEEDSKVHCVNISSQLKKYLEELKELMVKAGIPTELVTITQDGTGDTLYALQANCKPNNMTTKLNIARPDDVEVINFIFKLELLTASNQKQALLDLTLYGEARDTIYELVNVPDLNARVVNFNRVLNMTESTFSNVDTKNSLSGKTSDNLKERLPQLIDNLMNVAVKMFYSYVIKDKIPNASFISNIKYKVGTSLMDKYANTMAGKAYQYEDLTNNIERTTGKKVEDYQVLRNHADKNRRVEKEAAEAEETRRRMATEGIFNSFKR